MSTLRNAQAARQLVTRSRFVAPPTACRPGRSSARKVSSPARPFASPVASVLRPSCRNPDAASAQTTVPPRSAARSPEGRRLPSLGIRPARGRRPEHSHARSRLEVELGRVYAQIRAHGLEDNVGAIAEQIDDRALADVSGGGIDEELERLVSRFGAWTQVESNGVRAATFCAHGERVQNLPLTE